MAKLIYEDETYAVLGACFEVYREKGCGFLEAVYQECLDVEFRLKNVPAVGQVQLPISYKGQTLQKTYTADFICYDRVLLEIKAVSALTNEHRAQIQNYLHATGLKVGLLVNFGHYPKAEHERFVV